MLVDEINKIEFFEDENDWLYYLSDKELEELEMLEGVDQASKNKIEYNKCSNDIAYWFNNYVKTYNPKLESGSRWIDFKLFSKQEEFLFWLEDRQKYHEDGLVEKSRDVGMTWLNMGYLIHKWLFTSDFKGAVGSRKESLVDVIGDPDSILEKGRLLLQKLPEWMLPSGFDVKKHCGFMKFINPINGSIITGEAGDNIGRGGRNSVYFLDEAAFIERADRVEAALSQNSDCVIWVSTVNGIGNNFYKKRFGGICNVFIFDWRDDPRKTQEWYEAQVERFKHNPALMAAEVDRDYTASVEGIVIPGIWVQAAINSHIKLGFTSSGGRYAAADIAAGGANRTVFGAREQSIVFDLKESTESNTTITAHNLIEWTTKLNCSSLSYDGVGVGVGVKSTFALEDNLKFSTHAILGGSSPSSLRWGDGKTSKEMFHNSRAELYWLLRQRFERTYEMVNGIATYPIEDLISIPNHAQLISELSIPLRKYTNTGKIKIESKEEMRARGVSSPDWADMIVYLFAPVGAPIITSTVTSSMPIIDDGLKPIGGSNIDNQGRIRPRRGQSNTTTTFDIYGGIR